jgi:hypothetical protein
MPSCWHPRGSEGGLRYRIIPPERRFDKSQDPQPQGKRICPRRGQSLRGFGPILLLSIASACTEHLDSTFSGGTFARIPPNALALPLTLQQSPSASTTGCLPVPGLPLLAAIQRRYSGPVDPIWRRSTAHGIPLSTQSPLPTPFPARGRVFQVQRGGTAHTGSPGPTPFRWVWPSGRGEWRKPRWQRPPRLSTPHHGPSVPLSRTVAVRLPAHVPAPPWHTASFFIPPCHTPFAQRESSLSGSHLASAESRTAPSLLTAT